MGAAETGHPGVRGMADKEESWWSGLTKNNRWLLVGIIAFLSIGAFGAGLKYLDENAKTEKKLAANDRSLISSVNPFIPPEPTPQLSKEYIYAGSRLLAVEDANASAAPPTDLAIWRPGAQGVWWVQNPATGSTWTTVDLGTTGDIPIPGDYDGDGTTDFSVFRPSTPYATWYIIYSSGGNTNFSYAISTDLPAQADYDGDGKTDPAIYRPPTGGATYGVWHIQGTSIGYYTVTWGEADDLPASADYDGDGKADIGIWRASNRTFYSIQSSNSNIANVSSGIASGTYPWTTVSGDYDGDGKADYGVYDKSTANWYIRSSITGTFPTNPVQWGASGDTAVQNDYDGDGKVDYAVWTPSGTNVGRWHIKNSSVTPTERNVNWGQADDTPVPAFYRR